MASTLLAFGAGPLHVPALRWARECGLDAVVVDPDPSSPGRRFAREFHPLPGEDTQGHVALARRLARSGRLAAVLAAGARSLRLLAACADELVPLTPPRTALELALDPARSRAAWRAGGLPLGDSGDARHLVTGFFRDGGFVPAGIADRGTLDHAGAACEWSVQPTGLADSLAAYVLAERAARALGIDVGPVTVSLALRGGALLLVGLEPGFGDLVGASHVAPLVHGRSPIQAWFGAVAGAGGPFDELTLEARCTAGWTSIRAERAGFLAGLEDSPRALPSRVGVQLAEPEVLSPAEPSALWAYLWASAEDRLELEQRLRDARAVLSGRRESRQQVA